MHRLLITIASLASVVTLALCGSAAATAEPKDSAYQPLWPFSSRDEADRWSRDDVARDESPWHSDPAATALNFTRTYLDFTEIDRTTAVTTHDTEAWVGVGYALPNDRDKTVATIHLVRFGTGANAPWQVVGTRDTALTLETPSYGSALEPVITTGGAITGVDESVQIQVRQIHQQSVLGEFCCVAAGGQPGSWSAQVPVSGAQPGPVTVVAWTGGHVADVELFAVTGLNAA